MSSRSIRQRTLSKLVVPLYIFMAIAQGAVPTLVHAGAKDTTTVLTTTPSSSTFGQSVTLSAEVDSTGNLDGTVTFRDGGTNCFNGTVLGSATLSGSGHPQTVSITISSLSIATHTLRACFVDGPGGSDWNPSSGTRSHTVTGLTSTTTSLSSNLNPSTFGATVTLSSTVTGSSPTGTVTFKEGATTLGTGTLSSGSTTFAISTLSVGTHNIKAIYSGNGSNATSTSSTLVQVVNKATTTTSVGTSGSPSSFGGSVTFTATVSGGVSPTGTVTFMDGVTTLGTGAVSGGTATYSTSSLSVGSHTITAVYGGDTNNNGSTSTGITQVVGQLSTTTSLGSSLNPSLLNDLVTFTATVSGGSTPTGTVSFKDNGAIVGTGTVVAGVATFATSTLTVGSHTMSAVYNGDTNNAGSTSTGITQVVNQVSTSTSVDSSLNPSFAGDSVTFTATVSGGSTPTGSVVFYDDVTVLGTIALSGTTAAYTTSALAAGSHNVLAVYLGDGNNLTSTSSTLVQVVNPALAITTTSPLADGTVLEDYSQSFEATGGSGSYAWSLTNGALPSGFTLSATGSLTGNTTDEGDYTFEVTVTDEASNTASGTFTLHIAGTATGDLITFSKEGPGVAIRGEQIVYTLTVENNEQHAITHVEVADVYPSGLTYVSTGNDDPCEEDGGVVTCTKNPLHGDDSVTFTLTFDISEEISCGPDSELITNTATMTANHVDAIEDAVSTHIVCSASEISDLYLTKSGPNQAHKGDTVEYVLTPYNASGAIATNVVITDPVPEGLTFNGNVTGCTEEGGVVTCSLTSFEPLTLPFTVSEEISCGETIKNVASISGNWELVTTNNSAESDLIVDCVPRVDLQISKSGPESVEFGQNITYTLTATNNGPDNATGVMITDVMPVGLSFVSGSDGCSFSEGNVVCETSLNDGEEKTFTVTFSRVAETCTLSSAENYATINASGYEEQNESNNTSSTVVTQLTCPSGPPQQESNNNDDTSNHNPASNHLGHRTNELEGMLNGKSPKLQKNGGTSLPPGGFGGGADTPFTEQQLSDICAAKKKLDHVGYTEGLLRWTTEYLLQKFDLSKNFENDIFHILSTGEGCY